MSEWNTNCRPSRYSGGVFHVVATMRGYDECIERLEEQASAPRRWTQTIRGDEDRATSIAKSQSERRFVHIDEYASDNERSLV